MNNKRRKIQLPSVPCSWIGCTVTCKNDWEMNSHIETHLENIRPHSNGEYICVWGACEFTTACVTEIHRHIYYHGYYNGLLVQGKYELETNPSIPRCNAAPRECDKIPELKSNFSCEWTDCARTFMYVYRSLSFRITLSSMHRSNMKYKNLQMMKDLKYNVIGTFVENKWTINIDL